MRHRIDKKKLNRKQDHRSLLVRNLVTAFARNGKVRTTLAKSKLLQPRLETLVSNARSHSLSSRRRLYSYFTEKKIAAKFFKEVSFPGERKSGFTRLTKLGPRRGDRAEMALLEWAFTLPKREAAVKKVKAGEKVKSEMKKANKKVNSRKSLRPVEES